MLLIVAVFAVGCAKPSNPEVGQANSDGPEKRKPRPSRASQPQGEKPLPDFKTELPTPQPQAKMQLTRDEADRAVREFLAQTYTNINISEQMDAMDYPTTVVETGRMGWVVPISFTATNPRLMTRMTATRHLFLISRKSQGDPAHAFSHMQSDQEGHARLGSDWYKTRIVPSPKTQEQ
jgi:hypothetical protein